VNWEPKAVKRSGKRFEFWYQQDGVNSVMFIEAPDGAEAYQAFKAQFDSLMWGENPSVILLSQREVA
jgi:hypothetical protein